MEPVTGSACADHGRLALDPRLRAPRDQGVNQELRALPLEPRPGSFTPGRHNLAVGLPSPVSVTVDGNAGYFLGGLCGERDGTGPDIVVDGFVGWSVGENLMGGSIRVTGSASQSAGVEHAGRPIVIEGDASCAPGSPSRARTVAIAGNAGAMSGFMAQAGTILIGGDAGHGLGDSLYEARDLRRRPDRRRSVPMPWSRK